jgi:hypothetical protein
MLDIETLGTQTDSVILSIAAVSFNIASGEIKSIFNQSISLQSCIDAGLKIDEGAFNFWMKQNDEARKTIYAAEKILLAGALCGLTRWITDIETEEHKNVIVWGNGSIFDIGILNYAYNACSMKAPWRYVNERCYRTLVSLYPDVRRDEPFVGIKHDPIADCEHQIKILIKILEKIK